jgi:hypothetical protein
MVKSIFRHGKDLEDVASESTLDILQIDILEILTHDLLASVVDQHINLSVLIDMLLNGFLACVVVHEVTGDKETLVTFLLDHSLGLFGVFLLFWEVDDCHVCAFTGKENGD